MSSPSAAVQHLLDLLAVEGLSGREGRVAEAVVAKLRAAGVPAAAITSDDVHRQIPGDFERGNLIVRLPGTRPGPRLLFSSHLDTVPLCRGARPILRGRRIVTDQSTGLGADNRTAVAALVNLAETLHRERLPHPPLTLLFTVGEEAGLWGARYVDPEDLGRPVMGFNIDGGEANEICLGAIGAHRWEVNVRGHAAHAGVHPENGVSAALIAARGVAALASGGWFGRIRKGRRTGTANVGVIRGGEATNQVTDHVWIKGESRSHDPAFLEVISTRIRSAFEQAATSVSDARGRTGRVEFDLRRDYRAFRLADDAPVVTRTAAALRRLRLRPQLKVTDGGLDANYLNEKGIPTVTLGAGQHHPHTVEEYADLREFDQCCRLLVTLATAVD
jgi:tripeptide aminopeptidase